MAFISILNSLAHKLFLDLLFVDLFPVIFWERRIERSHPGSCVISPSHSCELFTSKFGVKAVTTNLLGHK